MAQQTIFSDVNLRAGNSPEELVKNEHTINQNIGAIFETPVGSKWYRPRIGSGVNKYLFDPIDTITANRIRREMEQALYSNGETRIEFGTIEVLPDVENQQYFVNIPYTSPFLEARQYNYQFNLSRGLT